MFSYQVKLLWQRDFYNARQQWRLLNTDNAQLFFVSVGCFRMFCSLHIFKEINVPLWVVMVQILY